jgi:hypothetical protein
VITDVKYDLMHKARLVAGDNWTFNHRKHIYSSEMHSYTENKKVYASLGPGFGGCSHPKILIIDKSLHGSKTSAARFMSI